MNRQAQPAEGSNAAWSAERMEYTFFVGARMTSGEKVLTAQEYYSGHTDWHDFNLNLGASLRGELDASGSVVTHTVVPAPVTYRGMPAARFWEFEDAQVDFGSINAGPEDLARMLLVEFVISYGKGFASRATTSSPVGRTARRTCGSAVAKSWEGVKDRVACSSTRRSPVSASAPAEVPLPSI